MIQLKKHNFLNKSHKDKSLSIFIWKTFYILILLFSFSQFKLGYLFKSSKLKISEIGTFKALDNLKIQLREISRNPFSIIPICERETPERKLNSSWVICCFILKSLIFFPKSSLKVLHILIFSDMLLVASTAVSDMGGILWII